MPRTPSRSSSPSRRASRARRWRGLEASSASRHRQAPPAAPSSGRGLGNETDPDWEPPLLASLIGIELVASEYIDPMVAMTTPSRTRSARASRMACRRRARTSGSSSPVGAGHCPVSEVMTTCSYCAGAWEMPRLPAIALTMSCSCRVEPSLSTSRMTARASRRSVADGTTRRSTAP